MTGRVVARDKVTDKKGRIWGSPEQEDGDRSWGAAGGNVLE